MNTYTNQIYLPILFVLVNETNGKYNNNEKEKGICFYKKIQISYASSSSISNGFSV